MLWTCPYWKCQPGCSGYRTPNVDVTVGKITNKWYTPSDNSFYQQWYTFHQFDFSRVSEHHIHVQNNLQLWRKKLDCNIIWGQVTYISERFINPCSDVFWVTDILAAVLLTTLRPFLYQYIPFISSLDTLQSRGIRSPANTSWLIDGLSSNNRMSIGQSVLKQFIITVRKIV